LTVILAPFYSTDEIQNWFEARMQLFLNGLCTGE